MILHPNRWHCIWTIRFVVMTVMSVSSVAGSRSAFAQEVPAIAHRPAFEVSPLVVRRSSAPGRPFAFELTIRSTVARTVAVQAVGLTQSRNGHFQIVSPLDASAVRFSRSAKFAVAAEKPIKIRGRWSVPAGQSDFALAGILVTDQSAMDRAKRAAASGNESRAYFVTQYLVRLQAIHSPSGVTPPRIECNSLSKDTRGRWTIAVRGDESIHQTIRGVLELRDGSDRLIGSPLAIGLAKHRSPSASDSFSEDFPVAAGSELNLLTRGIPPSSTTRPQRVDIVLRRGTARPIRKTYVQNGGQWTTLFNEQHPISSPENLSGLYADLQSIDFGDANANSFRDLTVAHGGRSAVRLQIDASEAQGCVAFPTEIYLPPGQSRKIRVRIRGLKGDGPSSGPGGKLIVRPIPDGEPKEHPVDGDQSRDAVRSLVIPIHASDP